MKLDSINKTYRGLNALSDIHLNLENKIYALLGPNGSGKTTLIRIVVGLLKPDSGNIDYDDKDIDDIKIGYLPQKFGVFKDITVYDQMKYYALLKDIQDHQDDKIKEALEYVNLIDEINKKCGALSGGMLRRLGIAQAVLGDPDLIIFDEPTTGLDIEEKARFKSILMKLKHRCPIIVSTHVVEDVQNVSESFIILKKGKIVFQGNREELMSHVDGHIFVVDSQDRYVNQVISSDIDGSHSRIYCHDIVENMMGVEATFEDAYMYYIKGMNNEKR